MADEQDNTESERQARLKAAEERSAKAREDNERRLAETKARSEASGKKNEERLAETKARSEAAAAENERRLAEIKSRAGKSPDAFAIKGSTTSVTGENEKFAPEEPPDRGFFSGQPAPAPRPISEIAPKPPAIPGPSGIADNAALNSIKNEIVSKLNELIAAVKEIGGPFGEG